MITTILCPPQKLHATPECETQYECSFITVIIVGFVIISKDMSSITFIWFLNSNTILFIPLQTYHMLILRFLIFQY